MTREDAIKEVKCVLVMCKDILDHLEQESCETTQMVDKSNFSQEQYRADLQSAFDCGKASAEGGSKQTTIESEMLEHANAIKQYCQARDRSGVLCEGCPFVFYHRGEECCSLNNDLCPADWYYPQAESENIEMQKNEVNEVLDMIRAEIENYDNFILCANGQKGIHIDAALDIIDKYKVKSEDKE